MDLMDNSKLEELMKGDLTVEMQEEFFDVFKKSQLFMPVTYSPDMFEGIENAQVGDVIEPEGQVGFDIVYLKDNHENNVVPLFTSSRMMESAGLESSAIAIYMSDLAEMLKQTDRYAVIAVNPFTELEVSMPIEAFLNLFSPEENLLETMEVILKILEDKSMELEEDTALFVRESEPFMKNDAVDGVFRPEIPFNVSTKKDFHDHLEYLNILLMPKSKKIVYIGDVVDDDRYNVIIAPDTEFEFVKDIDEFTSVWKCGAQPFYDKE